MLFLRGVPSGMWLERDGEESSSSCTEAAAPADLCLPGRCSHGRMMATLVFGQVVAACKAKMACGTGEAFLPCVNAPVAGEFIRAGESPFTALPLTPKWLLTCGKEAGTLERC